MGSATCEVDDPRISFHILLSGRHLTPPVKGAPSPFSFGYGTDVGRSFTHTFTISSFIKMHISFLRKQLFHLHTIPSFAQSSFSSPFICTLMYSIIFFNNDLKYTPLPFTLRLGNDNSRVLHSFTHSSFVCT